MNKVLGSIKFVVENSKQVKIHEAKINGFVKVFKPCHIRHWWGQAPFNLKKLNSKDRLMFLLIFNSISFSYWGDPKWTIDYKGKKIDGAFGMIAALGRAFEKDHKIINPAYLAKISEKEFGRILAANIRIPLFDERLKILRDIAKVLVEKYHGNFQSLVAKANNDALKLLNLIIENFPSFEDSAIYKGKKIYFYKRAQLLVSDIFQAFNGKAFGKLKNIQEITACADYKLPMILRRFGIFSYSKELSRKIDNQIPLKKGSQEETEVRANTIWAVELIKQKLKHKIPDINSSQINDHLWLLSQHKVKQDKPYHLVKTTFY